MSSWVECPCCQQKSPLKAYAPEQTWTCPSCGHEIAPAEPSRVQKPAPWGLPELANFTDGSASSNGQAGAGDTRAEGAPHGPETTRSYAARDDQILTAPHTPADKTPLPSRIGRFEIQSLLGEGSFGKVYEARDPVLDRPVALKVAKLDRGDSSQRIKRFLREAKAAANLRHPHIVPLYEFGQEGDQFFIASAFIRGRPLKDVIDEAKKTPLTTHHSPLTPHRAARIVRHMAEALAYAHEQGIVHRDIKPANTMLDDKDEPMVMDFGLAARQEEAEQLTHAGQILGTPLYMAPEQARGKEGAALPASDQYSLGIILYELLAGKRPFEGAAELVMFHHQNTEPPSPRKLNPKVPRDLETICLKCLEKDPARRYRDCKALAEDLRRWLADEPILAKKLSTTRRLARWVRREPKLAVASLGIIALLVAVTVVSMISDVEQRRLTKEADAEKTKALTALEEADRNLRASRRDAARLAINQAITLGEKNEGDHTLLWLAQAHEHAAAAEDEGLQMSCRSLLSGWARYVNPLKKIFWQATGDGNLLYSSALSPDLKVFARASSKDGRPIIADAKTGALHKPRLPRFPWQAYLAFSPDGKTLAVGEAGSIQLCDWQTGNLIGPRLQHARLNNTPIRLGYKNPEMWPFSVAGLTASLPGTSASPFAVAAAIPYFHYDPPTIRRILFSADGRYVVGIFDTDFESIWTPHGIAVWWDVKTQKPAGQALEGLGLHPAYCPVALSTDGQTLFSVGANAGELIIWDVPTRKVRSRLYNGVPNIHAIAVNPNGKEVAVGGMDGMLVLLNAAGGRIREFKTIRTHVEGLEYASRSGMLAVACADNTIRFVSTSDGEPIAAPIRHRNRFQTMSFSSDERYFYAATQYEAALYSVTSQATANPRWLMGRLDYDPFSHDGQNHVSISSEGDVSWWKFGAGKEKDLGKVPAGMEVLALSPKNTFVLIGDKSGKTAMLDCQTGRLSETAILSSQAKFFGFSPDGTSAMAAARDGAWIWDGRTGRLRGQIQLPEPIFEVRFSPDSSKLFFLLTSCRGCLWEPSALNPIGDLIDFVDPTNHFEFFPDSKRLLVVNNSNLGSLRIWNLEKGKPAGPVWKDLFPSCVAVSPGGGLMAAGHSTEVRLWDVTTGKSVGLPMPHRSRCSAVRFTPDGTKLITLADDGACRFWEAISGRPLGIVQHLIPYPSTARFSADGTRVVIGYHYKQATSLPVSFNPVPDTPEQTRTWVEALTGLEMDGEGSLRRLSTEAWLERRKRTYDEDWTERPSESVPVTKGNPSPAPALVSEARLIKDHRLVGQHPGGPWIWGAAMSCDGGHVLTGVAGNFTDKGLADSSEPFLRLWDVAAGKEVKKIELGPQCLNLDMSQDKRFAIAVRHAANTASYWDLESGNKHWTFQCTKSIQDVVLSPDGKQAAVGDVEGFVWILDAKTGKETQRLDAHDSSIWELIYLPDSRRFLTCGNDQDKTIRLWDIASGKELRRFEGHITSRSVAFFPKGDRILSLGQADKTLRLWDLEAGKELWAVQAPITKTACMSHCRRMADWQPHLPSATAFASGISRRGARSSAVSAMRRRTSSFCPTASRFCRRGWMASCASGGFCREASYFAINFGAATVRERLPDRSLTVAARKADEQPNPRSWISLPHITVAARTAD